MQKPGNKKSVRQERIISALEINPAMRVNALADQLAVSSETVRRDLAELDRTGRIKRTYGGAVRTAGFEPALAERLKLQVPQRERIAKCAVGLIEDSASLFIGGGATTLHFARALRLLQAPLTVITPALSIAAEVASNPKIEVMVLPGILDPGEGLVHGAETLQSISRFRTALAVVGASAVDENGVSEALLTAAQVYSAIVSNSEHTIVLADHSKFARRSLQGILEWQSNITVVTDCAPPDDLGQRIRQKEANIIVADDA